MTVKLRAEDLVAMTFFNGGRHVLHIDLDDLAKRFGKKTANRVLGTLVPDPAPRPQDCIVETWAARGSVGIALAGEDGRTEEVRLRALEAVVNLYRSHHPGVDVDTAKAAVLAAIKQSSTKETAQP